MKPEIVTAGFEGGNEENLTGWEEPSAYIQWKGTEVCMDFHCLCGAFCHLDAEFAYVVQCPHCKRMWEMPCVVYPRLAEDHWQTESPNVLMPDEQYTDDDGNAIPVPHRGTD